jgi:hypothetical protein
MDLDRTPNDIANVAAEEIRALNHRTLDPRAFQYPANVADVINTIATLVQRLPQALEQSETGLKVLQERGAIRFFDRSLGSTTPQQIADELQSVYSDLSQARRLLRQAHTVLTEASSPLAFMGGIGGDENDD